jgi:hypothetical protein
MKEDLSDDHAANRALQAAIRKGLLVREAYSRFDLRRHVGSLSNFQTFLDEFVSLRANLPPHDWLVKRLKAATSKSDKPNIVVRGPLELRVLRKGP